MDWRIVLVVFIAAIVLGVIVRAMWGVPTFAGTKLGAFMPLLAISAAGEAMSASTPVCSRVEAHMDQFTSGALTPDVVAAVEQTAGDIAYDVESAIEKIRKAKGKAPDEAAAKVILDCISHFYIYSKQPNSLSRAYIAEDAAVLKSHSGCFAARMGRFLEMAVVVKSPDEMMIARGSFREQFRRARVCELAGGDNTALLADITRKNIELRSAHDEIARLLRGAVGTPSGSITASLLEDCNRERRQLQERVYELRREADRHHADCAANRTNMSASGPLQARVDELVRQNAQLEARVRAEMSGHTSELGQLASLRTELSNCKQVLDSVLSVQDRV